MIRGMLIILSFSFLVYREHKKKQVPLSPEMKRHTVLVAQVANHRELEIASFFKIARSIGFKDRGKLESHYGDISSKVKRMKPA